MLDDCLIFIDLYSITFNCLTFIACKYLKVNSDIHFQRMHWINWYKSNWVIVLLCLWLLVMFISDIQLFIAFVNNRRRNACHFVLISWSYELFQECRSTLNAADYSPFNVSQAEAIELSNRYFIERYNSRATALISQLIYSFYIC